MPSNPSFTLENRFLPIVGVGGSASGSSAAQGEIQYRISLLAQTLGISEAEAEVQFYSALAGIAPGFGSVVAGMSLATPTYYHVIIAGQSNGIGVSGSVVLDDPAAGWMFSGGAAPGTSLGSFAAFQEMTGASTGQTLATAMVNKLVGSLPALSRVLVSNVAVGGARMYQIEKGTTPYSNSISQVTAAKALCALAGANYVCAGIAFVHGETDSQFGITTYGASLSTLANNYDADIRAISGQSETVRMFCSLQAGYVPEYSGFDGSAALQMHAQSLTNPRVVIVGTCAALSYRDGLHLSDWSQCVLGEMFAEAIASEFIAGTDTAPLVLASASLAGSTITATFTGGTAPIRFDYRFTGCKAAAGFKYYDDSSSASITSATITGERTVTIQLNTVPSGANKKLGYQTYMSTGGSNAPQTLGAGNVADSSERPSLIGLPMPRFAIPAVVSL